MSSADKGSSTQPVVLGGLVVVFGCDGSKFAEKSIHLDPIGELALAGWTASPRQAQCRSESAQRSSTSPRNAIIVLPPDVASRRRVKVTS